VEAFWTIVSFAVVFGIGAWVGFIFFYWFVLIPRHEAEQADRFRRRGA
jgi:hypothetical protein